MSAASVYFGKLGFESQTFNSDGTFTVPKNVNNIMALVVGGGGGGAGSDGSHSGGGGAGGELVFSLLDVTPSGSVTVQVGSGGNGGNGDNLGDGNKGEDSYILFNNRQIRAKGGNGGFGEIDTGTYEDWIQGGGGTISGIYQSKGGNGSSVENSFTDGGTNQLSNINGGVAGTGNGGGGGGAAFGSGADGGDESVAEINSASSNTGGGGGGAGRGSGSLVGGNGGSGIVIIYWKKD